MARTTALLEEDDNTKKQGVAGTAVPKIKQDRGNNGLRQWADGFLGAAKALNAIPLFGPLFSAIPGFFGACLYKYIFYKEHKEEKAAAEKNALQQKALAKVERAGDKSRSKEEAEADAKNGAAQAAALKEAQAKEKEKAKQEEGLAPKPKQAHGYKAVAMSLSSVGALLKLGASQVFWGTRVAASTAAGLGTAVAASVLSFVGICMWAGFFAYSCIMSKNREESQMQQGIVPKYSAKEKRDAWGRLISSPDGVAPTTGSTQIYKKVGTLGCGLLAALFGLLGTFVLSGLLFPLLAAAVGVAGSALWLNISQVAKNKTTAFDEAQAAKAAAKTPKTPEQTAKVKERYERMQTHKKEKQELKNEQRIKAKERLARIKAQQDERLKAQSGSESNIWSAALLSAAAMGVPAGGAAKVPVTPPPVSQQAKQRAERHSFFGPGGVVSGPFDPYTPKADPLVSSPSPALSRASSPPPSPQISPPVPVAEPASLLFPDSPLLSPPLSPPLSPTVSVTHSAGTDSPRSCGSEPSIDSIIAGSSSGCPPGSSPRSSGHASLNSLSKITLETEPPRALPFPFGRTGSHGVKMQAPPTYQSTQYTHSSAAVSDKKHLNPALSAAGAEQRPGAVRR